jgi:hypothetical protein
MPTREEIMALVQRLLSEWIHVPADIWVALYRLLLDYEHDVPRITDSNRLRDGTWLQRARIIQDELAKALSCSPNDVAHHLDQFMRQAYTPGTQRMNPVGIAFACAVVYLIQRFGRGRYDWKMEARIGVDVFPQLTRFRRQSVDIVAFQHGRPYAIVSSKWGIRHDRIRDPQEEADTYKQQEPSLKFFVTTNEYDSARLQKILEYPTIDGVFHIHRDLVWRVYGGQAEVLADLKDLTELFNYFP